MSDEVDKVPLPSGWVILVVGILILAAIECAVLVVSFVAADKVECTFLWCTFTTERGHSIISEDCYSNGVRVNCTQTMNWSNFPVPIK